MSEPTSASAARDALIGQLAHLLEEVEALRPVIGLVPEPLLAGRPLPGEPSVKELYALLAAADARVHLPFVERIAAEADPAVDVPEGADLLAGEPWNDYAMGDVLDRVAAARRRLVDGLRALPPAQWPRTGRFGGEALDVYGFGRRVVEHDLERLRAAGVRLHGAL